MPTLFKHTLAPAFLLATIVLVGAMSSAQAQDVSNTLTLTVTGDENVLYIAQTAEPRSSGLDTANQMDITITGDRNGGAAEGWRAGLPSDAPLMPGQLIQSGSDNRLSLNVQGNDNLFAMSQTGQGNRITGAIIGQTNQAMIIQSGMHNMAVFSQSGQGNTIMVSQSSL